MTESLSQSNSVRVLGSHRGAVRRAVTARLAAQFEFHTRLTRFRPGFDCRQPIRLPSAERVPLSIPHIPLQRPSCSIVQIHFKHWLNLLAPATE